jgi:hypothetical protein
MTQVVSRRLLLATAALAAGPVLARVADPGSPEQALIAAAERGAVADVRRLLAEGARHDGRDERAAPRSWSRRSTTGSRSRAC